MVEEIISNRFSGAGTAGSHFVVPKPQISDFKHEQTTTVNHERRSKKKTEDFCKNHQKWSSVVTKVLNMMSIRWVEVQVVAEVRDGWRHDVAQCVYSAGG